MPVVCAVHNLLWFHIFTEKTWWGANGEGHIELQAYAACTYR
jgi:hypothetical protein